MISEKVTPEVRLDVSESDSYPTPPAAICLQSAVKPSIGLEPMTPSLPWSAQGGTAGNARERQDTNRLHESAFDVPSRAVAVPHVPPRPDADRTPGRPRSAQEAIVELDGACKAIASEFFAPGIDRDDLIQEARVGAWKAHRDFREGRGALKRGAREMLDIVVDRYPEPLERDELADLVGMTASGGTFQTYLGTLRRNGLIDVDAGQVTANDSLFIAA